MTVSGRAEEKHQKVHQNADTAQTKGAQIKDTHANAAEIELVEAKGPQEKAQEKRDQAALGGTEGFRLVDMVHNGFLLRLCLLIDIDNHRLLRLLCGGSVLIGGYIRSAILAAIDVVINACTTVGTLHILTTPSCDIIAHSAAIGNEKQPFAGSSQTKRRPKPSKNSH
jgi:hypothetical protein